MARRREIDAALVWRLDRWGHSLADLVVTLKALGELGVGLVSLTEAFDLTTPTGRAMADLLAIFAEFERDILRARVRASSTRPAGKADSSDGHDRRRSSSRRCDLHAQKASKAEMARRLSIGGTLVPRLLLSPRSNSRSRASAPIGPR